MSEKPNKPAAETANKEPAPRTEVKLKKPHTHGGKYYDAEAVKAGVTIKVTAKQKARLTKHGII